MSIIKAMETYSTSSAACCSNWSESSCGIAYRTNA